MNNIDYKVGIYIRLSREDEEKESYQESESVQNQRTLLMQYLMQNKLNFVAEYVDDGVSGTSFDRPSFNRMIADIEAGKINMVVVKDLSRLGRNYIESGNYIEQIFPLFNVRFVTKAEDIDSYYKPTTVNNVMVPFKNLMNDEYCRDISNKIILANNARKRNGQYLGS